MLDSKFLVKVTSTLEVRFKEPKVYILTKAEKPVGFLELGKPVKIKDQVYDTIKLIYLKQEIRNTFAAGAFLIALKKQLQNPLILGSDSYGGVLYQGGIDLVKRMNKSAVFDVKILNLNTGEKRDFDELRHSKGETLVFENTEFPLVTTALNDSLEFFVLDGCESENLV
jgi:hypothetical protein